MMLQGDPRHTATLKAARFRVLQVPDNHTAHRGGERFCKTVEVFASVGIATFGLNEQKAQTVGIGGETMGFLQRLTSRRSKIKDQKTYKANLNKGCALKYVL